MYTKKTKDTLLLLALSISFLTLSYTTFANHSWGGYHWARTSNPFTLKLGNNLTSNWNTYLNNTSSDWNMSSVLDTTIVRGNGSKNCAPTQGRIEICNKKYGQNGWLGIASVWANGEHITQATVKMNDTYFSTANYNKPEWKNLVLCQEVGHTFGLDHQDEDFSNPNLNTCMDYTNNPLSNQHPNQHDYDMLETIYTHLDSVSTINQTINSSSQGINFDSPEEWGREIKKSKDGKVSLYMRDFGQGHKVFTHVFWDINKKINNNKSE